LDKDDWADDRRLTGSTAIVNMLLFVDNAKNKSGKQATQTGFNN